MSKEPNILIAVGAEGICEIMEDKPDWVREATIEEAKFFIDKYPLVKMIDETNRPYYVMAVTQYAPPPVIEKCKKYLRVVRLTD